MTRTSGTQSSGSRYERRGRRSAMPCSIANGTLSLARTNAEPTRVRGPLPTLPSGLLLLRPASGGIAAAPLKSSSASSISKELSTIKRHYAGIRSRSRVGVPGVSSVSGDRAKSGDFLITSGRRRLTQPTFVARPPSVSRFNVLPRRKNSRRSSAVIVKRDSGTVIRHASAAPKQ